MQSEEIFRPIDLESSLGRIEDASAPESDEMDIEPVTKTCEQNPFQTDCTDHKQDPTSFAPYPIAETEAEIKERQRLNDSVGKFLPQQTFQSAPRQVDWVPEDLEPVEGDDDFSLSSAEEESIAEENVEFERIEDPVSFWDSGVDHSMDHYNVIPSTVSYSSHADASMI